MGQSTNGEISYGIMFEEGHEFPWDADEFEGEIESWWRHIKGYKRPFDIYDAAGEYLPEMLKHVTKNAYGQNVLDKEIAEKYYGHRIEWEKANPLPVELVNACSCDYPQWILAVPGTNQTAYRGYPKEIQPLIYETAKLQAVLDFCKEFDICGGDGPKWWLSSYWG